LHALRFYQKKKAYYIKKLQGDIEYDKKSTFIRMLKSVAREIDLKNNVAG